MPHLDAPGMGTLGQDGPFLGQTVADALDEADEAQDRFDQKQSGALAPSLLQSASPDVGLPPPSGAPPVAGQGAPLPPPLPSSGPPGGRPPGYDVGGSHGSRSRGAATLLAAVASAAALGLYLQDPKGAVVGFLGAGSLANLYHGKSGASSPDPAVKTDAIVTGLLSAVGLCAAVYFGYGLYKEKRAK